MTASTTLQKVLVSVEGQTEETFVNEVLRSYFKTRHLWLEATPLKQRTPEGTVAGRGGYLTYAKIKKEIQRLLNDSSAIAITSMYDFYALAKDFPGYAALPNGNGAQRVAHLEAAFRADINHRRFCPYLQLHEFESLLFADVNITHATLLGDPTQLLQLTRIQQAFPSPEEINNDPCTAPSKRLRNIFPAYEKVLDGSIVILEIGLERLRAACPHFNTWLTWLESLT